MQTLSHIPQTDWKGNAEELVEEFARVLGEEAPTGDELKLNVRQLRYYQSTQAVSRPGRRGKEAIYTYRHLLQALVVKALLLEGWPLQKIADITSTASDEELLDMLPLLNTAESASKPSRNKAQQLVEQYALQTTVSEPRTPYAPGARAPGRQSTRSTTESRASERPPRRWRSTLELELPFSIRVSIEQDQLDHLTAKDIPKIAEQLERGLRVMRRQRQKRSKA